MSRKSLPKNFSAFFFVDSQKHCTFASPYGITVRQTYWKNEALCFDLVVRNLRNFKSKQDGDYNGSRVWRGLIVSLFFLDGFSQDLESKMWNTSSSTLLSYMGI